MGRWVGGRWVVREREKGKQPTSLMGFLFLKLPPAPCAVLLVLLLYIYILYIVFRRLCLNVHI